eukprot:TRINITY_DN11381_c0_g1::TRINITY_DN11381_c0_g1_i1::g.26462::m.26462 TRINITY_DN11381_c0_g1::TRINITY_DN11381_c0_g1_i1::g.26462  ORF type:complete len:223 (-),score=7.07,NrfD/PF03916.9/0.0017,IncA/PF04156.9/1.8e+02,IncA/PF04156.9/0.14,bZIP_2/PF07716.10/48,bZIP_2/PF07716.10/2.4 TRINITY_DN11381_c0_g1_i1:398-1066(-)
MFQNLSQDSKNKISRQQKEYLDAVKMYEEAIQREINAEERCERLAKCNTLLQQNTKKFFTAWFFAGTGCGFGFGILIGAVISLCLAHHFALPLALCASLIGLSVTVLVILNLKQIRLDEPSDDAKHIRGLMCWVNSALVGHFAAWRASRVCKAMRSWPMRMFVPNWVNELITFEPSDWDVKSLRKRVHQLEIENRELIDQRNASLEILKSLERCSSTSLNGR